MRQLWRLCEVSPDVLINAQKLQHGMQNYLRHADLVLVMMRIGSEQRSYLVMDGCAGCVRGRCLPGCATDLLRRLFRSCLPIAQLELVTGGLAWRDYRRTALAWPGPRATPFAPHILSSWSESRLIVHWRATGKRPTAVAILAVGSDGPAPTTLFHAANWRSVALPMQITRSWLGYGGTMPRPFSLAWPSVIIPTEILFGASRPESALVVTSALPNDSAMPDNASMLSQPSNLILTNIMYTQDTELVARLTHDLAAILDRQSAAPWNSSQPASSTDSDADSVELQQVIALAEPAPPISMFPIGPGEGGSAMDALAMEQFATTLVARQVAISRSSIAALLNESHKRHAKTILLWLDRAALLSAPANREQPYRQPRALEVTELDRLAEQLSATPIPTEHELKAAGL